MHREVRLELSVAASSGELEPAPMFLERGYGIHFAVGPAVGEPGEAFQIGIAGASD